MATRWGIVSAGKISHDFVAALSTVTDHTAVAIAARSLEKAQEFATRHSIPTAYGSYEELAKDSNIDVVYIGAINTQHFPLAKMMIEHGKNVICEKPLCVNVRETTELMELARKKGVFLMEAIWSRFFEIYEALKKIVESGEIGEVTHVVVTFGIEASSVDRLRLKEMAGGSMLDIGIYCLQLASFIYKGEKPEKIVAGGHLNQEGIDESVSASLVYSGGRLATFTTSLKVKLPNEAVIAGTKGHIKLFAPFWCPAGMDVNGKVHNFPLPQDPSLSFNHVNSIGLRYEAMEVRNCLAKGLKESPLMTLEETLLIAEMLESIRKQVGVIYEQDK